MMRRDLLSAAPRALRPWVAGRLALAVLCGLAIAPASAQDQDQDQDRFRFRTGVDLINVSATVTDASGRFVEGLSRADFVVYEDDQLVDVTHFSSERVPVSLGIVLDTSGSMAGDKIAAARLALDRFLANVIRPEDEVFLYRFDSKPYLVQGWTSDRKQISEALQALRPDGATALYDAVAQALPLLDSGKHFKKALLVISDGNDTNSRTTLETVRRSIRESDTLVYAIAIDAVLRPKPVNGGTPAETRLQQRGRPPRTFPIPMPGRRPPPRTPPIPGVPAPSNPRPPLEPEADEPRDLGATALREPVNVNALRQLTDDSGGFTELVRDARDLNPTTGRIAEELGQQYYLGYPSRGAHDGRWHTIRVEARGQNLVVRARRGYIAPQ
ncbi:MAG: VWA domain-containing protein [Vicinamibacterales bacterium]